LGRVPIDAALVASSTGFHGCYRELGARSRGLFEGAPPAPQATESEAEPHEFDCRFEARSDLIRLGSIVARCVAFAADSDHEPNWEVNGSFFSTKGGEGTPFYLGPTTYPGIPDELVLALAHGDAEPHACAPFIDVLDVRMLPGDRRAVLYAESHPCEMPAPKAGEEPAAPEHGRLRLALFPIADPSHPHLVLVPGEDEGEPAALAVYEFASGADVFVIERQGETTVAATGQSYVDQRLSLFALTRGGRAGPLLELPEVENTESGCDAEDTVKLERAELDEEASPVLVVELEHQPKSCAGGAAPDEAASAAFAAFSFDPELGRFDSLALDSEELSRRPRATLDDASRADETWRAAPAADACTLSKAP
jgi:hypothetical protein